jgi:hypothetical protein
MWSRYLEGIAFCLLLCIAHCIEQEGKAHFRSGCILTSKEITRHYESTEIAEIVGVCLVDVRSNGAFGLRTGHAGGGTGG